MSGLVCARHTCHPANAAFSFAIENNCDCPFGDFVFCFPIIILGDDLILLIGCSENATLEIVIERLIQFNWNGIWFSLFEKCNLIKRISPMQKKKKIGRGTLSSNLSPFLRRTLCDLQKCPKKLQSKPFASICSTWWKCVAHGGKQRSEWLGHSNGMWQCNAIGIMICCHIGTHSLTDRPDVHISICSHFDECLTCYDDCWTRICDCLRTYNYLFCNYHRIWLKRLN